MSKHITILLADDHALLRGTLKTQLNNERDMVVVADVGNADEAVVQARRLKPDVALLDIDMPGQFCFEAAKTIKTQSPETRIVFLSAFHNDQYIEQAIAVQASGYITKSEPPGALIEAIRTITSGATYYSPEVRLRIVVDSHGGRGLARQGSSRISTLSRREMEVLRYIGRGHSKKQIAANMYLSTKTVDSHTQRLMNKLEIHDRAKLVRYAIREGLVEA